MSIDETREIKNLSQKDQAKLKSVTMYCGSNQLGTYSLYLYDAKTNAFSMQDIQYTPALYKIIDEILVNALDHWLHFPKLVKEIEIEFDKKTGVIFVKNGGPSIGVRKTKTHDGREVWVPQMALSDFNSSSNYEENKKRYTGGVNGIGAKITSLNSVWFEVDTVDTKAKKRYQQRFENRLDVIHEPTITKAVAGIKDYTSIRFLPVYDIFGYQGGYKPKYGDDLFKLIESRAFHAAVYTDAKVILNGQPIIFPKGDAFVEYAKMHLRANQSGTVTAVDQDVPDDLEETKSDISDKSSKTSTSDPDASEPVQIYATKLTHDEDEPALDLCIGASDGKFQQVSVINGLCINGGNYIKAIQNQIIEALQPKVEKILKPAKVKFNRNMIINSLFVFVRGKMANPEFDSQTKSKIMNPLENFAKYKFRARDWKYIWDIIGPQIESTFLNKTKSADNKRVIRGDVNVPKYEGAQMAGGKNSADCILWIAEGDSACGTLQKGIAHKCSALNNKFCGTFNIGGVPVNCRAHSTEKINPKTKERIIVQNTTLKNNERICSLLKVLGLSYGKTYDADTEEGRREIASLRYGRGVIIIVDQDVDGHGIFGMLLNFFEFFWPNLVKIGYVKKFNTPIIRAFTLNKSGIIDKKAVVLEFFTMSQFKKWISKEFGGDEERAQHKYFVKYYKGLGTHTDGDIPKMFADYEMHLLCTALDTMANENLSIFYGKDTNAKKTVLRTPPNEIVLCNPMNVSDILHSMVKEFHRDKIARSLPHVMDGQTESRRKVLWTARQVFGQSMSVKNQVKVAALAAETTKLTAYMHGEQCLADTIILMGQTFPGSNHLPMLIPHGHFGSRKFGGKDAASARYIYTQLNSTLCYALCPAEDDFLLEFVFDEGQRCEPKYLVPILPLAVLENLQGNIGVGWSATLWARDISSVFRNVRAMITGDQVRCFPMRTWLKDNTGEIRISGGKEYSVGVYEYNKKANTIHITELPLGMYPRSFLASDKEKPKKEDGGDAVKQKMPMWARNEFAKKPLCESSNEQIDITLYLKPGEYEKILSKYGNADFDAVTDFLGLRTPLNSNINCIGADDTVLEFTQYEEVVNYWFGERKRLYQLRVDRQVILLKLYIKYLKNIIKFMDNDASYGFTTKTDLDTMKQTLEREGYDRINEGLLKSPKFTPTCQLQDLILNSGAATYTYLLSLSHIDKSAGNSKKRKDALKAKEVELADLTKSIKSDSFPGASIWLRELDLLEKVIKEGSLTNWGQS
jgi:DNA topoisomerase-2